MRKLQAAMNAVRDAEPMAIVGRVSSVKGLSVLVRDLPMPVGGLVRVGSMRDAGRGEAAMGEVVGFSEGLTVVMMLEGSEGVRSGDEALGLQVQRTIGVGSSLLGRVLDGLGRPIDGGRALCGLVPQPLDAEPVRPMLRQRIHEPMSTGVRALDLMTTLGRGQRMGVFAGPGVGKSTLMGSIARNASSDVNVVALIGERGREVQDFLEASLGAEGLARSVVIVATGDETPLMRVRAAMSACAVAEYFRSLGLHVMLMMDSVTRFAHAMRQIGLAAGEPPTTKGYTPSVFATMARLLERAGAVCKDLGGGSITGLYTVLVEGDDMTEPVADAARGILDGHIILSRKLAHKGHYPAVDVLDSISRVMGDVTDKQHQVARRQVLRMLAVYREIEDLVQIGAYARGVNPESDLALAMHGRINELLKQSPDEPDQLEYSKPRLIKLAMEIGNAQTQKRAG
jgi:flagellum-specific ATP synthase